MAAVEWLRNGAPFGLGEEIPSTGIFPVVEGALAQRVDTGLKNTARASHRNWSGNYISVDDDPAASIG